MSSAMRPIILSCNDTRAPFDVGTAGYRFPISIKCPLFVDGRCARLIGSSGLADRRWWPPKGPTFDHLQWHGARRSIPKLGHNAQAYGHQGATFSITRFQRTLIRIFTDDMVSCFSYDDGAAPPPIVSPRSYAQASSRSASTRNVPPEVRERVSSSILSSHDMGRPLAPGKQVQRHDRERASRPVVRLTTGLLVSGPRMAL